MIAVPLQIAPIDTQDDAVLDALMALEDVAISRSNGIHLLTVYVNEGQNVCARVMDSVRRATCRIPGLHVARAYQDLVAASDIADRVGVSREAVRKWAASNTFPSCQSVVGQNMRVWRWIDVVTWLLDAKKIDMDEDLPSIEEFDHIDACVRRTPDEASEAWARFEQFTIISTAAPRTSVLEWGQVVGAIGLEGCEQREEYRV